MVRPGVDSVAWPKLVTMSTLVGTQVTAEQKGSQSSLSPYDWPWDEVSTRCHPKV